MNARRQSVEDVEHGIVGYTFARRQPAFRMVAVVAARRLARPHHRLHDLIICTRFKLIINKKSVKCMRLEITHNIDVEIFT